MNNYNYNINITTDDDGNIIGFDTTDRLTLGDIATFVRGVRWWLGTLDNRLAATEQRLADTDKTSQKGLAMELRKIQLFDEPLSVRCVNGLSTAGIVTLEDLVRCTSRYIIRTRNLGRKSIVEIEQYLAGKGRYLGELPAMWLPVGDDDAVKSDMSDSRDFWDYKLGQDECTARRDKFIQRMNVMILD